MDMTDLAAIQARPRLAAVSGGNGRNASHGGHPGAGSRRRGGGGGGRGHGGKGGRGSGGAARQVSELFAMAGGGAVAVKEKVFVTANGEKPLELCVMGENFSRVRRNVSGGRGDV